MSTVRHIRTSIFQVTQAEFAALAGVGQSSVSRWEKHGVPPTHREMQAIRNAAIARAIPWDDRWFFEIPQAASGNEAKGATPRRHVNESAQALRAGASR